MEVQSEILFGGGSENLVASLVVFITTVGVKKVELLVIRNVVWQPTHFRSQ